ncbi:hypothetical protein [Microvirga pakistanensis]|uniref:hypothetical protein n=1 Tax=Microvirga pakistanensis TaxID=1682650 RepID=UPI00106D1CB7|nr:hypothetical protein [Microvirga pakistanensis]
MRVVISACTHKAFSYGLMPLARLKLGPIRAANDDNAQSNRPDLRPAFRTKRAAYGRSEFVIALLVLIAGIVTLPFIQRLAMPITTAAEKRPTLLPGSPIAPVLLQPQENG